MTKKRIKTKNQPTCNAANPVLAALQTYVLNILFMIRRTTIGKYSYICLAVRGAEHFNSAEIIPYEPDMYNDSAGKRYWYSLLWLCFKAVFSGLYNIYNNENHNF